MISPKMSPLWNRDEIAQATGAGIPEIPVVTGVSIDTRTLQPGDLFFAIQGVAQDGHEYVRAAFAKGASAAVVTEGRAERLRDAGPLVVVDDVLAAMQRLGEAARRRVRARIVAATGSVGKTGTKEALLAVLSHQGATHASAASYNNHWGVPLTLARMPRKTAYGVFEIGMNHPGEIVPLTAQVRPDVALITTVEPVHLEFFTSIAAIADAKAEIFTGLEPGGTAILNRDNPQFERLKLHAAASQAGRIVTFGENANADVRAVQIIQRPDGSRVEATIFGRDLAYDLGAPGRHIAINSLGVLAAVQALGADVDQAAAVLASVSAPTGRGERSVLMAAAGPFTLIDESYNANPASMRAALSILGGLEMPDGGRRIAVLGQMGELGPNGPDLHAGLIEAVEDNRIDLVFAAGDLMRHLTENLPQGRCALWAKNSAELVDQVLATVRSGDAVMVKGSLSTKMALVVEGLKKRYDAHTA